MFRRRAEQPMSHPEPAATQTGEGTQEPVEGNISREVLPTMEDLIALSSMSQYEMNGLARRKLGLPEPDEIVPDAAGATFFTGERMQRHKASGAKNTLLHERLELVKGLRLGKKRLGE